MVLKWTRTKPEPLKYFEPELNLNPNRNLKRFDTLLKSPKKRDIFFIVDFSRQTNGGGGGGWTLQLPPCVRPCCYRLVVAVDRA